MEDFKIYIFVIQKSFLCSLGEISTVVYSLHYRKKCDICLIFFKSNAVSFRWFIDNFDILSTKEQLVDESLGDAFLCDPRTPRPITSRSSSVSFSLINFFPLKPLCQMN